MQILSGSILSTRYVHFCLQKKKKNQMATGMITNSRLWGLHLDETHSKRVKGHIANIFMQTNLFVVVDYSQC